MGAADGEWFVLMAINMPLVSNSVVHKTPSPVVIIALTEVFDGTVPSKIIFPFP